MYSKQQIRDYYKETKLELPSNSKSRYYKFFTEKGWITLSRPIKTEKQLREALVYHTPLKVYHSISFWLNPHKKRSKYFQGPKYKVADNLLLGGELFIDIDVKDPRIVNDVINRLKADKDLKLRETNETPRGFHIIYDFTNLELNPSPYKREKQLKALIDSKIEKIADLPIDLNVLDITRIRRLRHSLDAKSGKIINPAPEGFLKRKMTMGVGKNQPSVPRIKTGEVLAQADTSPTYALFLKNKVKNSYYPYIESGIKPKEDSIEIDYGNRKGHLIKRKCSLGETLNLYKKYKNKRKYSNQLKKWGVNYVKISPLKNSLGKALENKPLYDFELLKYSGGFVFTKFK